MQFLNHFLFNETLMLWKSMEEMEEEDHTRYKKSSLMFDLSLVPFGSRYIYLQHSLSSSEVSRKSATVFTGSRLCLRGLMGWAHSAPVLHKEPLVRALSCLPC